VTDSPDNLLAIDVGNSRVKLGWFAGGNTATDGPLPEPADTFRATVDGLDGERLAAWLAGRRASCVALASVSRVAEAAVVKRLGGLPIQRLASETAPIALRVDEPARIGVDRVMAAVAANRLRQASRPAIVVDVGTAITVDLIAADGALEGGAILPGPGLATRALGEQTDALPDIRFGDLDDSPDAVGRSTAPAIRAGVFWGSVGAIRELIARQRDRLTTAPQVFLTGGAAPSIARLIGGPDLSVRCLPHLVLSGIAIAAASDPS